MNWRILVTEKEPGAAAAQHDYYRPPSFRLQLKTLNPKPTRRPSRIRGSGGCLATRAATALSLSLSLTLSLSLSLSLSRSLSLCFSAFSMSLGVDRMEVQG